MAQTPAPPMHIPSLVWQALYSRGLRSNEDIDSIFKPSLKTLRSPFLLKNMDIAVQRMVEAFRKSETVCVYADFDLDGTSGLALLRTGLELLGFKNVMGYQPRRLNEGYGVHIPAVEEIAALGAKVLVTVDVGITAATALNHARKLGLDVILTDHHLPHGELPDVMALINPNQGDCPSGLGHLAGVGVAFYFLLAVRAGLRDSGLGQTEFDPKELLDFFVIGTLTDMVPLRQENRTLTKFGLLQLAKTKRPGLRALLDALDLSDRELTSGDVAIKFAPKLNALSRLESSLRPIDMFLASDMKEAQTRASEVVACNQRRVAIQKEAESIARAKVEMMELGSCLWIWSERFHRGVVGLVATRLAQEYSRPVFVGSLNEESRIVGSARLPRGWQNVSLVQALESARAHLERFGGHAQAAGFELKADQAEALGPALAMAFSDFKPTADSAILYDAEGELSEITHEFMRWHEGLGPFGTEFEAPQYRLGGSIVKKAMELKGGHLRLDLQSARTGAVKAGIWFSPPESSARLVTAAGAESYEVLAEPAWNYFRGQRTLQLQIKGIRPQTL